MTETRTVPLRALGVAFEALGLIARRAIFNGTKQLYAVFLMTHSFRVLEGQVQKHGLDEMKNLIKAAGN
jgi:hypothetical protein